MGEGQRNPRDEEAALRLGIDLGMTLIDTAEMYGEGGAEEVVGAALRGRGAAVQVVTKFYPHHAGRRELRAACARSLKRLGVEAIDCYLYHWRGPVPLEETVRGLEDLVSAGQIRRWGVSNFDVSDLEELVAIPGGEKVAANQVLYNLAHRGIEFDLLPWCAARGIDVMAYSPLDEGRLLAHKALAAVAARVGATPAQAALAWTMRLPGVCSIPKSARLEHVRANHAASGLVLDAGTLAELDGAFPPPRRKRALEMI
jgi:diketogulonate reductase-like aldo/keto reductase